jgi:hypothetical protein
MRSATRVSIAALSWGGRRRAASATDWRIKTMGVDTSFMPEQRSIVWKPSSFA